MVFQVTAPGLSLAGCCQAVAALCFPLTYSPGEPVSLLGLALHTLELFNMAPRTFSALLSFGNYGACTSYRVEQESHSLRQPLSVAGTVCSVLV